MADRTVGPAMEAKRRLVLEVAGTATAEQVKDARARLKEHPKVPRDAVFLIEKYRWLTYELAGALLRERAEKRTSLRRSQGERQTASAVAFIAGAAIGFIAAVILTKRFWS